MTPLRKFKATVSKECACLVGYGTAFDTWDGHIMALVAPTRKALVRSWERLSQKPFDKIKVRRVAIFEHNGLTTKKVLKAHKAK
jgi:hypothetical protein